MRKRNHETQLTDGIFLCKFLRLKHVKLFASEGNVWFCRSSKSEAVNYSKNLPGADFYLTESDY